MDLKPSRKKANDHYWKILIVDDDQGVHDVTKLALHGKSILGRQLKFVHAFSGAQAQEILRKEKDIALVLLDVVMETDDAGLRVVDYLRNELQNNIIRIILRTGQPGHAPEMEVVTQYDINDYKNKAELTAPKLFCALHTALSTYLDLVILDSTKRDLERRERDFKSILHNTPALISYWDWNLVNRFANRTYETWFGWEPEGIVGEVLENFCDPEFKEEMRPRIDGVLRGEPQLFERRQVSLNGSIGHFLIRYIPDIVDGTVEGFFVLGIDINERKLFEDALAANQIQLAREIERAEAADTAKTNFLAGMSHELRTPLNAVIGFSQMLAMNKNGNLDRKQLEYCGFIEEGGHNLLRVVDGILEFSATEPSQVKLSTASVSCGAILDKVKNLTSDIAQKTGVSVSIVDNPVPNVRADETRLCQCIVNFVTNGIKFNRKGGSVLVSSVQIPGNKIRFAVEDTGMGIDIENHDKVFQAFQRLGVERMAIGGTGIGLSLVKRYVEEMGGDVGFSSVKDKGSVFWMDLPAETSAPVQPQ